MNERLQAARAAQIELGRQAQELANLEASAAQIPELEAAERQRLDQVRCELEDALQVATSRLSAAGVKAKTVKTRWAAIAAELDGSLGDDFKAVQSEINSTAHSLYVALQAARRGGVHPRCFQDLWRDIGGGDLSLETFPIAVSKQVERDVLTAVKGRMVTYDPARPDHFSQRFGQ